MDTKEYMEKWRSDNKGKIQKYNTEKVTCECGSIVCRINLSPHKKSKKHLKIISEKEHQNVDQVEDKIVEYVIDKMKSVQELQDDDIKKILIDRLKKKLNK